MDFWRFRDWTVGRFSNTVSKLIEAVIENGISEEMGRPMDVERIV